MNFKYKIDFYKIPFAQDQFFIDEFIRTRKDFILGDAVAQFEQLYAGFTGVDHAIGVSNGLDALKIAIKALDMPRHAEVIVPAHTYIASIFAIIQSGLKPVLVDVNIDSFNIDPVQVKSALTDNVKAIVPVHLYGRPCEMEAILEIARGKDLWVVEDNAQSQGADYRGDKTGSMGHINATSFYPSKNLGALGDAGAITTRDPDLAHKCKLLRNVGSDQKYVHEVVGYNARMDTIQAAILVKKLKYLNEWNECRREIAARYWDNLKTSRLVFLPSIADKSTHVYHQFVIRTRLRDELQLYLKEQGIDTLIHYPIPNHLQPALSFLGYTEGSFPVSEEIARSCLSLPIYPDLRMDEVDYVCEKILDFERTV